MDRRWIVSLPIALGAACASPNAGAAADRVVIRMGFQPAAICRASLGDKVFALPEEESAFSAALRARAAASRRASVVADELVPYKCFGYAVVLAQRAGFRRVGFIAEPRRAD